MDETTTRVLFQQISADAPRPSAVDLHRVVRRAERRRRRHRRRVASVAGLTVLVLTSAVAVLVTGVGPDRTDIAAPAVPGPGYGPTLTSAPAEFDPARHAIQVGWLPSGNPYVTQQVSTTEVALIASDRDGESDYWIRLAPRGHALNQTFHGMQNASSVAGPEIGGEPSRWFTAAGTHEHELRWQWAPGAEAGVLVDDGPDALETAVRIATSTHVTDTALRLPFTIATPPAYRLDSVTFSRRGDELRTYGATYQDPATGSFIDVGVASNTLTLDFEPNAVIAHRPGQTIQDGEFSRVRVRQPTVQFEVSCAERPKTARSVAIATGTCRAAADTIRLVANPLRWDTWPRVR
ncbi:hypothetical protein [Cryptosporangium phraense]|uniref:Uncharacterized protein n=1 Tax=Cryptosporangium phraense TaxID=2593070 RepID=A0A545AZS9_9ACTN|nr:hypothetical protein [Cryptosporangium phraense]TQS46827.1 hypothetical protein FL583_00675 [Cryptosporangium phraense]